jgi:DNA-directed RNA polymerase specialized sigma subunit
MTGIKQVRTYLWCVRDAERELKLFEQEYEQAKADILHLKAIQYDADKVSGGKIGDLSDAISALEGYAERVNAKWDKLIELRKEAGALIDTLQDGRYREVLRRRYLWGQTLEKIAADLRFDYRWVKRLHGRALAEFQKLTPESPPRPVI